MRTRSIKAVSLALFSLMLVGFYHHKSPSPLYLEDVAMQSAIEEQLQRVE